MSISLKIQIF